MAGLATVPPSRIDIMTSVTGLEFDAARPKRIMATFGDVVAPVLGLDDMRKAKRAAGRGIIGDGSEFQSLPWNAPQQKSLPSPFPSPMHAV